MLWLWLFLLFTVCIDSAQTPLNKWQAVAMSSNGQYMTAAVYEGGIFISSDYGNNWIQTLFAESRWFSIAMSSSGEYQVVTSTSSSRCAVSFDYGQTWTVNYACTGNIQTYNYGFHTAMDSSGQYRASTMMTTTSNMDRSVNDHVFRSSNYGNTYARYAPTGITNFFPYAVGISGNGRYQIVGNYYGSLYYSTNYGASYSTALNGGGTFGWTTVALSHNGTVAVASSFETGIYRSTDYGLTWNKILGGHFIAVAGESKGVVWYATDSYFLYTSTDSGSTWTTVFAAPPTSDFVYQSIATSSGNNGATVAIAGYGKCVYVSYNRGQTWSECIDTRPPTFAPTVLQPGPSAVPTLAPSGPTRTPSGGILRPTFRPSTLAPTSNSSNTGKNQLDKVVGNVPTSFSMDAMSTTNQIAVAIVIVLIVCCCCIPGCYFMFRKDKNKNKKGKKQKGKMQNGLLVEDAVEDEEGDIETVQVGKNGKGSNGKAAGGGTFGGGAANTKPKDPTAALAARKKKKKNAPPPPPRHKKKRNTDGDEEGGQDDDDGGTAVGDEENGTKDQGGDKDGHDEDGVDPAQSPLHPQVQHSGKIVQKKASFHVIPRPAGPPTDLKNAHSSNKISAKEGNSSDKKPIGIRGEISGGGFLSSLSSKSKASQKKYKPKDGNADETAALVPPSNEENV